MSNWRDYLMAFAAPRTSNPGGRHGHSGGPHLVPAVEGDVHCLAGLTKQAAEEVLDWLEANGQSPLEITFQSGQGFTIRYRVPPAGAAGA